MDIITAVENVIKQIEIKCAEEILIMEKETICL